MSPSSALVTVITAIALQFTSNTAEIINEGAVHDGTFTCSNTDNCTVICDEQNACYQGDIYCPTDYDCNVQCATNNGNGQACTQGLIRCPQNGGCDIYCGGNTTSSYACSYLTLITYENTNPFNLICDGGRACNEMLIDAPNDYTDLNINCTGDHTCFSMDVNCPSNATCNLNCDGDNSCFGLNVNCPANSQCYGTLSCSGYQSCFNAIFPPPPPDQDFVLNCDDYAECHGATITCPENYDCDITCDGEQSCKGTTITCPDAANCDISCIGKESCQSAVITWPTDESVDATLECFDDQACQNIVDIPDNVVILAPTSSPTTKAPTTKNPTKLPTKSPTLRPEFGVIISITFNYSFANLTDDELANLVENITSTIIDQGIDDIGDTQNCVLTNYNVTIEIKENDNGGGSIFITATIQVCDEETADELIVFFENNLDTEFIDKLDNNDDDILYVDVPTTEIEKEEIEYPTTTIEIGDFASTILDLPSNTNESDDGLLIAIIFIVFALLGVVAVLFYFYKKRQSKEVLFATTTSLSSETELQSTENTEIGDFGGEEMVEGDIVMTTKDRSTVTTSATLNGSNEPGSTNDVTDPMIDDENEDDEKMFRVENTTKNAESDNDDTDEMYTSDNDQIVATPGLTPQSPPKSVVSEPGPILTAGGTQTVGGMAGGGGVGKGNIDQFVEDEKEENDEDEDMYNNDNKEENDDDDLYYPDNGVGRQETVTGGRQTVGGDENE